jgi:hypothetical protein
MAINTNKTSVSHEYYCLINEVQYGPYDLATLITKIDRNTLVWREGIDWIKASEVIELKKFFPDPIIKIIEKDNSNSSNANQNVDIIVNKNMFSSPFSFDGRIRRTEYGLSFIIYIIAYAILIGLVETSSIFALGYIPLFWFLWAQGAKRCHDRGNSGWYQIIPFYVFWMFFAEGDEVQNEYGFPK